MNGIYLIIGGNLGDRENLLRQCRQYIRERIGRIVRESGIYETKAWGKEDTPDYLNQVLAIETSLSPVELMAVCLQIEKDLGRTRGERWEARIIDIDILFYDTQIMRLPGLTIPHPAMSERRFVLTPLQEIAPHLVHPVHGLTINELLRTCEDPLQVHRLEDDSQQQPAE